MQRSARAHVHDHDLDRTFAALADPTRRAVVELLRDRPELAGELNSTPAGLSRHLRVLRESGLVADETLADDARVRVYCLRRERFDELRDWVHDVETFWTGQLASFKEYAERTRGKRGRSRGGQR